MNKKWFVLILLSAISIGLLTGQEGKSLFVLNDGLEYPDFLSHLEKEIIIEVNKARTNPSAYARALAEFKKLYIGYRIQIGANAPILTKEGLAAVDEAIAFLDSAAPVPMLRVSRGLSLAAKAHVKDQGPKGLMHHKGSDGSSPGDRMSRFGKVGKAWGENIEFGSHSARHIVFQLIIDDGVKDRGHRLTLFNPEFTVAGVSFGPHDVYGSMCVIDFAGSFTEKND